jgi:cyclohexadienyl dehydratase
MGAVVLVGGVLASQVQAQPNRLARIKAADELQVCMWPGYYGISLRNAKTGQVMGLDADMAQELARSLKVRLKWVDTTFSKFIPDVLSDQCDIVMTGIAVTPQRATQVAFSQPYMRSDMYAVTTRSHQRVRSWTDIDQAGVRVAVAEGSVQESVMRERIKKAELVVIVSPQTREAELEAGRVDVFMSDYPFTRKMLDYNEWAQVIAPPAPFYFMTYAWVVKPGDAAWLATVNQFLSTIKADGRLRQAALRYRLDAMLITDPRP